MQLMRDRMKGTATTTVIRRAMLLTLVCSTLILTTATAMAANGWLTPITVDTDASSTSPHIKTVNGNPAMAYWANNADELRYARAVDAEGSIWGAPLPLDTHAQPGDAALAIVDGRPAIAYSDGAPSVQYVRANDADGASWSPPITIATGQVNRALIDITLITVAGHPAVAFRDSDDSSVRYVRANDPVGTSWGAPLHVVGGDVNSDLANYPSMTVVDGWPAIAFAHRDAALSWTVRYVRANDATGSSWGSELVIDSVRARYISMIVADGHPAVSYTDVPFDFDIRYVRALDSTGTSWGEPISVSTGVSGNLAIAEGKPAIAYQDYQAGPGSDLLFISADDAAGSAWSSPATVVTSGTDPSEPTLTEHPRPGHRRRLPA